MGSRLRRRDTQHARMSQYKKDKKAIEAAKDISKTSEYYARNAFLLNPIKNRFLHGS